LGYYAERKLVICSGHLSISR